jgi:hypothetical protein
MAYPEELLFRFELGPLRRGALTVSGTLRLQPGLICSPLLFLRDFVCLSLFELFALTTLFLLDLLFLSFADKPGF